MLIKILGGADIILGLILIFLKNVDYSNKVLIFFAMVLFAKAALGFLKDFGSWVDAASGIVFLLSIIIPIPGFIGLILGLFLIQKGLASFF